MTDKSRRPADPKHRIEEAVAAHDREWVLIPLNGKIPRLKNWPQAPKPDLSTVKSWARDGNVGVRTGRVSGIIVIDEDPQNGGNIASLGLPKTVTARSGGEAKGRHLYFRYPITQEIRNSTGRLGTGIDVRGEGGQVVLPGATHPDSGGQYSWVQGLSPGETPLAELPSGIIERLTKSRDATTRQVSQRSEFGSAYVSKAIDLECQSVESALPGTRNNTLNSAAFNLGTLVGAQAIDRQCAEVRLLAAASRHYSEEFTEQEARNTIKSGIEAGIKEPRKSRPKVDVETRRRLGEFPRTEMGNAERLVHAHRADLKYCFPQQKWHHFDGARWRLDTTGEVQRLAKMTVRSLLADAADEPEDSLRAEKVNWARRCERNSALQNMISLSRSEPGIPVEPADFDSDPDLLNTPTGTFNLKTESLHKHRREDLLSKCTGAAFDVNAEAPTFTAFVERILPDESVRDYLQRALGYALLGEVTHHALHFFVGVGANGKSTLTEIIQFVLGDYALTAPSSLLLTSKADRHPTELATLHGKRAAFCSETPEGGRLDENLVKSLTGGDRITARRMKEDFWQFAPTHKLFVSTNHLPRVVGTDHGTWRRIRVIPFDQVIPESEQDHGLGGKLRAEAPGILNWLIKGYCNFRNDGLKAPDSVRYVTNEYRADEDDLSVFIEAHLAEEPGSFISNKEMTDIYENWSKSNRIESPLGPRQLFARLKSRGFKAHRRASTRGFIDVALANDVADRHLGVNPHKPRNTSNPEMTVDSVIGLTQPEDDHESNSP